jgi:WD40 repeat protein
VAAVATAVLDGRPIAVTGTWRGTLQVWDLTTREPLHEPLAGHEANVTTVATAVVEGRPVAVTGSMDGTVRIWDLATGTPIGKPLRSHRPGGAEGERGKNGATAEDGDGQAPDDQEDDAPSIEAVATTEADGRPVAVAGSEDGLVQVWDLATGTPVGEPFGVADGQLITMATALVAGRPVIVTGGEDGTVRTWDLATHAQLGPGLVLPLPVCALAAAPQGRLAVGFDWEVAVFGPPAPEADTADAG